MNARALNVVGLAIVAAIGLAIPDPDAAAGGPRHRARADGLFRHGDPRSQPSARLGLRRHPLFRPGGVLRFGRVHLCDRDVQHWREHRPSVDGDRGSGGVRRAARLLHLLRTHQRRLPRRDNSDGDADPVQFHQFDGWSGIPHRFGEARRLQRHPGNTATQRAGLRQFADRSRRHVLSLDSRFAG